MDSQSRARTGDGSCCYSSHVWVMLCVEYGMCRMGHLKFMNIEAEMKTEFRTPSHVYSLWKCKKECIIFQTLYVITPHVYWAFSLWIPSPNKCLCNSGIFFYLILLSLSCLNKYYLFFISFSMVSRAMHRHQRVKLSPLRLWVRRSPCRRVNQEKRRRGCTSPTSPSGSGIQISGNYLG